MGTIELSVVIPTYRKPAMLRRTLDALSRTERPSSWEVVVVDDGSGDGRIADLLREFEDRLPLVDASLATNQGRARARNHGWASASGTFVLFLDDDIVVEEGAVLAHLQAQARQPGVYLGEVVTAEEIVDSSLFDYLDSRGVAKLPPGERCPARYFLTQNASVPRDALEAVGGFDESFEAYGFEDMEIAFRLEDQCQLSFFHLAGARGEHIHHHRIDEYLDKKRECGAHTLPLLAELHPHRLAEMHLDLLPTLRDTASPSRRLQGGILDLLVDCRLHLLLRWKVQVLGAWMPAGLRHRLWDLLVLSAYADGLRSR